MKKLIGKIAGVALGWLRGEFGWIVLLAAAVALAGVYVLYQRLEADRDALLGFAVASCARAGQPFEASATPAKTSTGRKITVRHKRGVLCAARIGALADFERDTAIASATLLAESQADRTAKSDRDRTAARTDDARTARAQAEMEKHNAKVQADDRVDGDWFARLNDLAGVRADR